MTLAALEMRGHGEIRPMPAPPLQRDFADAPQSVREPIIPVIALMEVIFVSDCQGR
jgi:hypothetical protein